MNDCPQCGSNLITVESSREMRVSIISCDDCDYTIRGKMSEDALVLKWNKIKTQRREE